MNSTGAANPAQPVGWFELFYDLVFVSATITFSDAVSSDPRIAVVGEVTGAFVGVWLIWVATTCHANYFREADLFHRSLVLAQMLLLTMGALAVGDGLENRPGVVSVTYALLAVDVAVMYGRHARGESLSKTATRVRNDYLVAAIPLALAAIVGDPLRPALWAIGLVLLAWPALRLVAQGFSRALLDEHHFVERLGLLTIILCGESFVKVSLLAADGSLDAIDLDVLVTLFVTVFGIWWVYFDDIPFAGVRPDPARASGWLLGHLLLQVSLVGVAIGYAKLLRLGLGGEISGDRSLLTTVPLAGVVLAMGVIGVCSRRVPQRGLVQFRLVLVGFAAAFVVSVYAVSWINVEETAIGLTVISLVHAIGSARLCRSTRVREGDTGTRSTAE